MEYKEFKNVIRMKYIYAKRKVKEYSFMIKPIIYIALIFTIAISAIIRADFNYCDDQGRVATGYKGWMYFSRFTSQFLSKYIHVDDYLTDISPLTQLLAICMMAISAVIILYVYKNEKKFSIWDIIAVIPLGLSPFFLACFSYKYDSPYMAMSVLVSAFPLLFIKSKVLIYSVIVIVCTLLMCTTYQASSGIFLMLVLLICLKKWNKGESIKGILKILIVSFVNYLAALLIFKVFIMNPVNDYVSNSIISSDFLISISLQHLYKYFYLVVTGFKKEWLFLIVVMCISFIYSFVRESNQKKYIAFIVSTLALIIMAMLCFGLYPILREPLFAPRSMYGFGVFITLVGVVISTSKKTYISKIVVLILSWSFFVFAFTYGNALKVQDEYTDFRVNLVINDLNSLEICTTNEIKTVHISGTIGQSPVLKNMPQDYEILNRLIPIQFREAWYWGQYYFYNYFDLRNMLKNNSENVNEYNLPILKDTMYHTIRGNNKYILIELK